MIPMLCFTEGVYANGARSSAVESRVMTRTAQAVWNGDLKSGNGQVSTGSGAIEGLAYSFRTRFEEEPGTNPEELIAAAHAGCFSMATSVELGKAGFTPDSLSTSATLTFEPVDGKPTVTKIHLEMVASVPNCNDDDFLAAAQAAKAGCPISRLLNCEITLSASLS